MSGPKTSSYGLAASLRAKLAEEARQLAEQRRRELEAQQRQMLQDTIAAEQAQLEQIWAGMRDAVARFPNETLQLTKRKLEAPKSSDIPQLEAYRGALRTLVAEQRRSLERESQRATANESLRASLGSLLAQIPAVPAPSAPDTGAVPRSDRLLQRLELEPGEAPPEPLVALAEQLDRVSDGRAGALETELRYQIQRHNEGQSERRRLRQEAADLFATLPGPVSTEEQRLAGRLSRAALGEGALDGALRAEVAVWQQRAKARAEQTQVAQVLRDSLEDLGYDVEEGFSTLFVDQGMVHFTRPDWAGYYVRLRINPAERYLNFNLVRAAAGQATTLDQERRDLEAEQRWCGEYGTLLRRLEAEGLDTQAQREVPAGTMAVQTLAAEPRVGKSAARRRPKPVARRYNQP